MGIVVYFVLMAQLNVLPNNRAIHHVLPVKDKNDPAMKKNVFIFVFTLCLISTSYAGNTEYQLGVDGVACPFCVYGIEKQLSKLEGIDRIETDIENSLVILIMKEDFTLNETSIREAVTKAGFSLRSFTLSDKAE